MTSRPTKKPEDTESRERTGLLSRIELEQENRRLKQRVRRLAILHEIGQTIITTLDPEEVLTRIVEAAVFIIGADEGALMLLDKQRGELFVRAQKGLGERRAETLRLRVDDSLAGTALETRSTVRLNEEVRIATGYLVKAVVYVPLTRGEDALGVLSVDNRQTAGAFGEDDEHLLLDLADYAVIALENAKLIENLMRRNRALTSLHQTGHSMLQVLALDRVLRQIADNAHTVLEADTIVLYEYDENQGDAIIPPVISGEIRDIEHLRQRGRTHRQSVVFKMIHRGKPFYAPNAVTDWAEEGLIAKNGGFVTREHIASSAGIPLIVDSEKVGVMFVNYRTPHIFDPSSREMIELFASQAAIAIQNARLMQHKERMIKWMAGLLDIGQAMVRLPSGPREVLSQIVENTTKVVHADYALVFPYDSNTAEFRDDLITYSQMPKSLASAIRVPRPYGMTMRVMNSNKGILVVENVLDTKRYPYIERGPQSFLIQAGVQSLVGIRLQVGQEPVGVLYADCCSRWDPTKDERQILRWFANQAAIAIYNTRRYQELRQMKGS